ncbi:hypothetical protein JQX13_50315 [Archangium violaceum]|uniref:hypothetical protein n=1 Tax=Archangium violaceum TaxID=83451 RepID=UPI00193BCC93|nr:hypothetical protein [Archangium violaceum]QRK08064.1 hypothetical protein JQX13_50315 [Archangium violaceum]
MRLRDIQHIIETAALPEQLNIERYSPTSGSSLEVGIHDANQIKLALRTLRQVPALEPFIKPLEDNRVFMGQSRDTVVGVRNDLDPVVMHLTTLARTVSLLRKILGRALPPEKPTQLVVQIPEPGPIEELERQVGDLRRFFDILTKIEAETDNGERVDVRPDVMAFDSGSFYLELLLPSATAIAIVGAVIHAAFKTIVVWETWKQAQARVAVTETLVKEMDSIARHNDTIRTHLLDDAVKKLKTTRPFSKVHGETEAALRAAVQQGTELLEKRMLFLPPPASPNEVLSNFPTPKAIERLFSGDPLKLLEAKNPDNPDSETTEPSNNTKATDDKAGT